MVYYENHFNKSINGVFWNALIKLAFFYILDPFGVWFFENIIQEISKKHWVLVI